MSVHPDEVEGPRRGRPRKFAEPSRAVTLTLPQRVIEALESVDTDLSRAVVRIVEPGVPAQSHEPAELATFGSRSVIAVHPTRALEEKLGIVLVPLADGRALIAFDDSMTMARLELKIEDALDDHSLPESDARVFESVRQLLRETRRSDAVALRQQHIIVIEPAAQKRKRA